MIVIIIVMILINTYKLILYDCLKLLNKISFLQFVKGEESEVEQAGMGPSREVSGSPRGAGPAGGAGPTGPVESERVGPWGRFLG